MSTATPSQSYETLSELMTLAVEVSKAVPEIKGITTHSRNDFWFFEFTSQALKDFATALAVETPDEEFWKAYATEVAPRDGTKYFASEGAKKNEMPELALLNLAVWIKSYAK